jgi:repressor LexA
MFLFVNPFLRYFPLIFISVLHYIAFCDNLRATGGDPVIRLKELRDQRNITQLQFAKIIGVAQNTVSNWENGVRLVDIDTAKRIAAYFDVSVDYFLGAASKPSAGVMIPVYGRVQAGIPIEAVQDILDYEEITPEMAASGEHFALQIRGDSMEPRICDGDVVIVRQQPDVDSGSVAVVMVNGQDATVKKVIKKDTSLMLVPFNAAYEPLHYSEDEVRRLPVTIIGRVVELRGKFK